MLSLLFVCAFFAAQAQLIPPPADFDPWVTPADSAQQASTRRMHDAVYFLADDRLEGRATGSPGEGMASNFISSEFKKMGLLPAGENHTYLETFTVQSGKTAAADNYIILQTLYDDLNKAWPHPMSGNGKASAQMVDVGFGISAPDLGLDEYADKDVNGKIALMQFGTPDGQGPHSQYIDYADDRTKILMAKLKGAVGVVFYSADPDEEIPGNTYKRNTAAENIPVYIVNTDIGKTLSAFHHTVTMKTDLQDHMVTGHNVFGFIDNHAQNTVVIGAHYDHLGHGEIEGSLYRGAPAIHNGADDNASGVALVLELARMLSASDLKNNNYLVMAFSGEEMGLFGSKAFTTDTLFNAYHINYMFNYDMVGRLDTANTLIVNGAGTSSVWHPLIDGPQTDGIHIRSTDSGIGPSDQTSFYLKDIPVLHFFTGSHSDYHKPSDDADKVNYPGMEKVLTLSYAWIDTLNDKGKLDFIKTKDSDSEDAPRFTVTLGVVPDYAYAGKGMRIDGISDGKPADKAGLQAGDIVIALGEFQVADMMEYMRALSKFNKGDATVVHFMRGDAQMEAPIQF